LAREKLAIYKTFPAYQAMFEREGLSSPEEIVICGTEADVRERFDLIDATGVTDVRIQELCPSPEDAARTRAFLKTMLAERQA
jgi:hypothetical protein